MLTLSLTEHHLFPVVGKDVFNLQFENARGLEWNAALYCPLFHSMVRHSLHFSENILPILFNHGWTRTVKENKTYCKYATTAWAS
jgi:hypothetical protein